MDNETGEINSRIFICTNPETGEDEYLTVEFNQETGEEEYFSRVWNSLPLPSPCQKNRYATQIHTVTKHKEPKEKPFKASEIRAEFITAIVFLLPTMIIFSPLLGVIVITFDILLHKWCHKQNSRLKLKRDNSIYYQSPLHTIYKEFCSTCVAEQECEKINKIQNIRHNRKRFFMRESLRRVVT